MLAAFVMTATTGKDAVKNVDLADELKKSRQESAKLRQEIKEIVERENKKLRAEDNKLKKEADKLRKENEKLRRQDDELRKEDAELKRQVHELRQDNSEIKTSLRQRDENNTVEMQNVVRNSFGFRQMDITSELKKTINKQIKEYLDENRVCVSGVIQESLSSGGSITKKRTIEFGQTFQRIPAFAAALSLIDLVGKASNPISYVDDFHVTSSSAVVRIFGSYASYIEVNWIACL